MHKDSNLLSLFMSKNITPSVTSKIFKLSEAKMEEMSYFSTLSKAKNLFQFFCLNNFYIFFLSFVLFCFVFIYSLVSSAGNTGQIQSSGFKTAEVDCAHPKPRDVWVLRMTYCYTTDCICFVLIFVSHLLML